MSIQEGDICWTYGPFSCGLFNDLQIFQRGLKKEFVLNEKVQADKIYGKEAPCYVRAPWNLFVAHDPMVIVMEKKVRSRHEHVNKRLEQWSILQKVYPHDIENHGDVFRAMSCMTQICGENGEQLGQVVYVD